MNEQVNTLPIDPRTSVFKKVLSRLSGFTSRDAYEKKESPVVKIDAESVITGLFDVISKAQETGARPSIDNVPDYQILDEITVESLGNLKPETKDKLEVVGKYLYESATEIEDRAVNRLLEITGARHDFLIREDRDKLSKQDAILLMTEMFRVEAARSTGMCMMVYPEETKGDKMLLEIGQALGSNARAASKRLWAMGYNRLSKIYHYDAEGNYLEKPLEPEFYPARRDADGKPASNDYSYDKVAYFTRPLIRQADILFNSKGINASLMMGMIDDLLNCHISSASGLKRYPPEYIPMFQNILKTMRSDPGKYVGSGKFRDDDIHYLGSRMTNLKQNLAPALSALTKK